MPHIGLPSSSSFISVYSQDNTYNMMLSYLLWWCLVSLLINHRGLLQAGGRRGGRLCVRLADWWSGAACPRVWADEGEGEREAAG